jgi:hypothetical protein
MGSVTLTPVLRFGVLRSRGFLRCPFFRWHS